VTSAAVRANPGLDYSPTEDPIDNKEIRRIDGSIRRRVPPASHGAIVGE